MSAVNQGLRQLVASDQLEAVLDYLMVHTDGKEMEELHEEVVIQSGRYEEYLEAHRLGSNDPDDLARTKVNIRIGILGIIEQLPSSVSAKVPTLAELEPQQRKGISEHKLKNHVLILMILMKFVVIVFLFTLWESGGFTTDQFTGTLTLLIPLFTTYTALMMKDLVEHRHTPIQNSPRVSRSFQWITYMLLLGYGLGFLFVMGLKPRGALNFQQMSILLTLLEGGLGVYIGRIVFALFKKEGG